MRGRVLQSDALGRVGVQYIIRQNSVATIKTEGLLGDKYVEISFGSEKAPEIESGDTIKGETPVLRFCRNLRELSRVPSFAAPDCRSFASSF